MFKATAADNILKYLIIFNYFSEKVRPDILCESLAQQMIHMKCKASVTLINNFKKLNSHPKVLLGTLRVKLMF